MQTRDNHYVPQWYQRGFIEPGFGKLRYLDLQPELHTRGDGTKVPGKNLHTSVPAQCFYQTDLYSTFFGFHINDEIERRLFGEIDRKGAPAIRAFTGTDIDEWTRHFEDFFEFVDAQKLRTPKGLDWLRLHYPFLDQNQLMFEMQGIRMMHCTLWTEGVREIVSAEDASVKFLVSDHPVTVFNHAVMPEDPRCAYPNDPLISWKASQTIYPLDRNFCLILSNLEYAQNPQLSDPCTKRTNARNFRSSIVRTDAFIRTRRLTDAEVSQINFVLKSRAKRFVAAGREEWLFPERAIEPSWPSARKSLLPPDDELWRFGGETYVRYEDGSVDYQDQFGRSEPRADFLLRPEAELPRRPKDPCGCGMGGVFQNCCATRPVDLRPSWSELSIRERNLMHIRPIANILGLAEGSNWEIARRELTDEKIVQIHNVFRVLWPLDTDLISLLPKPDGRFRALFTGLVDPRMVIEYALGASAYFGEILVQNPFLHPGVLRKEFSPTESPSQYRQEVLKNVALLLDMAPLIDAGIINFFPDPCHFDLHLRHQMMQMAKSRTDGIEAQPDPRTKWLQRDDFERSLWSLSEDSQRHMIRKALPELPPEKVELLIGLVRENRHHDPLSPLQADVIPDGSDGGLLMCHHLIPNFEMSLYLAQSTGSVIVTDSPHRWREMLGAAWMNVGQAPEVLPEFKAAMEQAEHLYVGDQLAILKLHQSAESRAFKAMLSDVFRYLTATKKNGAKPNWESQLPKRFARAHSALQREFQASGVPMLSGKVRCIIPSGGIRDNTINRLLLMSSVDHYLEYVPMAFFIERPDPREYQRSFLSRSWDLGDLADPGLAA